MAAGVNVAFGNDCGMDPWYGTGSDYMLEVAHMGLHVAQMTSQKGIRQCFEAVTTNAAKVMHLNGYGMEVGCDASFVLLQAHNPVEAIRLRANRLKVWRKGKLLAETAEVVAKPHLTRRPNAVGFSHP
jgi:cytosine deaminase